MTALIFASLLFVGSHVLFSSTPLRGNLIRLFGESGFLGLYSLLSLFTLGWMIVAFFDAPHVELWGDLLWARGLLLLLMPIVSVFLVAGTTSKNPTMAVFGRLGGPEDIPGIFRITRHPVLWALALWSGGHMLANGDQASLLFFGAFLTLSLAGPFLVEQKKRAERGATWEAFVEKTSILPFAAILGGRTKVTLAEIGWSKILIGLLLYAALMLAHEWLSGVPLVLLG